MPGPSSRKALCQKEVQEDNFQKHKDKKHNNVYVRGKTGSEVLALIVEKDTLKFFPELLKVLKIFATLPVTSCEAERSFSTLKRLKTFIRSTMGEERLNSLAVLNIHREICNLVMEKDTDKLVNKFSEGQGRSMYFF